MQKDLTLQVTKRQKLSTKEVADFRKKNMIPAVLYSHGNQAEMLWVEYVSFSKTYTLAGQSSVIALSEEGKKATNAIIQEIQTHPLTGRVTHADFYQVRMDEKIEVDVPLVFVGIAPAVKEMGGVFVKTLEEINISCLPGDLPHQIEVDISSLVSFESQIKIEDIMLPKGVEILSDKETTVALVEAPRSEAEMASLDEKPVIDVTKVEGVVKEEPVA